MKKAKKQILEHLFNLNLSDDDNLNRVCRELHDNPYWHLSKQEYLDIPESLRADVLWDCDEWEATEYVLDWLWSFFRSRRTQVAKGISGEDKSDLLVREDLSFYPIGTSLPVLKRVEAQNRYASLRLFG